MTLICTVIGNLGIVNASDSNLTRGDGGAGGTGAKIFRLGFCEGTLALAGDYTIKGQRMDEWMPDCIKKLPSTDLTLKAFAHHLAENLASMVSADQVGATMFQIAGYATDEDGTHPEMWFVRNVARITEAGDYERGETWEVEEQFWTGSYKDPQVRALLDAGYYVRYFNGTPTGRIAFHEVSGQLETFFGAAWANPQWEFTQPKHIRGLARLVELQLKVISLLFENSNYSAPFIGGDVQLEISTPPPNARRL
jgi:hypothetical protein